MKRSLFIILLFICVGVYAQEAKIKGLVTDGQGIIVGASVYVEGTGIGTQTDESGYYELKVSPKPNGGGGKMQFISKLCRIQEANH
jgi:hypothetical protein